MTLRHELDLWAEAQIAHSNGKYRQALNLFTKLDRSAMISTNMGLVHAALGEHEKALRYFTDATTRDAYLTIAYFQRGVSHFLLERYRPASRDFKRAWGSLRGNEEINYEPLGLPFRLFASEVLFNLGLSRIRLDRMDKGLEYLEKARMLTMIEDHDVIEDVIRCRGEGYTVFSIAPGVLYWPSKQKLTSVKPRNFMGEATLIATADPADLSTDFSGLHLLQRRQRNLHRKSQAVLARRVSLVSSPDEAFARGQEEEEDGENLTLRSDEEFRLP